MNGKTLRMLLLVSATLQASQQGVAQTTVPSSASVEGRGAPAEQIREIGEVVNRSLERWQVPGAAISIVKDGQVLLVRGYGVRDARTDAPVTADTIFPVASLAKAFTAFAAGVLVDEGTLDFNGKLEDYVPSFEMADPIASHEVTLRDFLAHRSGLRGRHDFFYYRDQNISRAEVVRRLRHFDLHNRPRHSYQYSNMGYVVVGRAMELAAGKPFDQLVSETTFQPLEMSRTTFSEERMLADPDHAVGRWYSNSGPVDEVFLGGEVIDPHGGINSTARDMANWMLVNLGEGTFNGRRIISEPTLSQIHKTQIPAVLDTRNGQVPVGYAMGWNTLVYRGDYTILHTGGVPGFQTITVLVPRKEVGITVFTNGSRGLFYTLAFELLDRVLGHQSPWLEKATPPPPPSVPARKTATRPARALPPAATIEYEGTYEHPGYGKVRIASANGGLVAEYHGFAAPLRLLHHEVFLAEPGDPTNPNDGRVQFTRDLDGQVQAIVFEPFEPSFMKLPDPTLSDASHLRTYIGTYKGKGYVVRVSLEGKQLFYRRDQLEAAKLTPFRGREYSLAGSSLRVSFKGPGQARSLLLRDGISIETLERID